MTRPVSVCVDVFQGWQNYISGVFRNDTAFIQFSVNHCVQAIGVMSDGTTNTATNYWILKNQWGTNWG